MNITTKIQIQKPTKEVFEAFVDPNKIRNFWFSHSSDRWEQGKTIQLQYEEYNAELLINIIEVEENRKIVYTWGEDNDKTVVTITISEVETANTIIQVIESGFQEDDSQLIHKLLDQKEGLSIYGDQFNTLRGFLIH